METCGWQSNSYDFRRIVTGNNNWQALHTNTHRNQVDRMVSLWMACAQKSIAYAYIGNSNCTSSATGNNNNKLSAETFHKSWLGQFEGCATQVAEMCCLKMKSNSPILLFLMLVILVLGRIGRFNWGFLSCLRNGYSIVMLMAHILFRKSE